MNKIKPCPSCGTTEHPTIRLIDYYNMTWRIFVAQCGGCDYFLTFKVWGVDSRHVDDACTEAWNNYPSQDINSVKRLAADNGMVLVPLEPTKEQVFAGMQMNPKNTTKIYKAMLNAAKGE